jgi:hypothetical protein
MALCNKTCAARGKHVTGTTLFESPTDILLLLTSSINHFLLVQKLANFSCSGILIICVTTNITKQISVNKNNSNSVHSYGLELIFVFKAEISATKTVSFDLFCKLFLKDNIFCSQILVTLAKIYSLVTDLVCLNIISSGLNFQDSCR